MEMNLWSGHTVEYYTAPKSTVVGLSVLIRKVGQYIIDA